MSEPFLAEVKIIGFNFAPRGWAFCDGQILPINQNQSLYSLLGTTYGGDGETTFALPDLRGRTPIHVETGHPQGQRGGAETHQLQVSEIPSHTHALNATTTRATTARPGGALPARAEVPAYRAQGPLATMASGALLSNGPAAAAHNNMMPSIVLNFVIALQGLFPSR